MVQAAQLAMLLSAGFLGWSDEVPQRQRPPRRPQVRITWLPSPSPLV